MVITREGGGLIWGIEVPMGGAIFAPVGARVEEVPAIGTAFARYPCAVCFKSLRRRGLGAYLAVCVWALVLGP